MSPGSHTAAVKVLRFVFLASVCALAAEPQAQRAGLEVAGVVADAETGRPLPATVAVPSLGLGTVADSAGAFRLAVPSDTVRVVVTLVGYRTQTFRASAAVLEVALVPLDLGEVVVDGGRERDRVRPGQATISGRDAQAIPALLGEADVLKTVQLLPGVRGGQEGTAGLYVRGGSPDQTLVLLDGVPVYNATHLFGFLSAFHAGAVEGATLSTSMPARHGGRLASVLEVGLRRGDLEERRVTGQVGLLSTSVLAEGPVVPGRASVLVSARRAHVNLLAGPFIDRANRDAAARDQATLDPSVAFHDVNARLHWRPSDRDVVDVGLYSSGDAFGFTSTDPDLECGGGACRATGLEDEYAGGLDWRTASASVRAQRRWSNRALGTVTLLASDYAFDVDVSQTEGRGGPDAATAAARYRSGIGDLAARADVDLGLGAHAVRVGASLTRHVFTPGALSVTGADAEGGAPSDTTLGADRTVALEAAVYLEDEWRLGPVTLGLGVRAARYATPGHAYPSLEPRAAVSVRVGRGVSVQASAGRAQQPVHLLTTGAGIGLPADLWVPADSVGPQRGEQVAAGLSGSHRDGRTTWSLGGYWRSMRGLVAYRDGAAFTTAFDDWQDLVVTGEGRSRGLEVLVRHRAGAVTAQAAYTLARTDRRFDAVGGGAWFPYRYDRRHDVSATVSATVGRFDLSAVAVYGTGDAVTLPAATYDATFLAPGSIAYWTESHPQSAPEVAFGPRNGHRLPAYARLDLGATFYLRRGPRPHARRALGVQRDEPEEPVRHHARRPDRRRDRRDAAPAGRRVAVPGPAVAGLPVRVLTMRPLLAALLCAALAACDLSSALDIETPAFEEGVVIRSVLEAGRTARVRITTSRDPYGAEPARGLVTPPSRTDAAVTLWRDGAMVETLTANDQTCYGSSSSTCNAETGRTETSRADPYPCGVYTGAVALEAGATYTLRVRAPGLGDAESTVTVPLPPVADAVELAPSGDRRRYRLQLTDPPGLGHRYGLTILREFDRYTTSVCRVGGPRDTLIVLTPPRVFTYRSDFATRDPVLLTGARESGGDVHFVTFPDDAFDGRTRAFDIEAAAFAQPGVDTGAVRLQVTAISPLLYEAYQQTTFDLDENPFAEPSALPVNVEGGFGRVGAVAVTEVRMPPP